MTERVIDNQAGLAKPNNPMRAQTPPIPFHATFGNLKHFQHLKRDNVKKSRGIEIEIDSSAKPNVNQATKSLDSSLNRFRISVDQFLKTMRKGDHDVRCFFVIGCLHLKRGLLKDAIKYFRSGLYVKGITEEEKVAIFFQLGRANEKLKNFSEATYYYYRVHLIDPGYLSVTRRLLSMAEFQKTTNK